MILRMKSHRKYLNFEILAEMRQAQEVATARDNDEWQGGRIRSEEDARLDQLLSRNDSSFAGTGECCDGTRVSVLRDLEMWIEDTSSIRRCVWLNGVA